VVSDLKGRLAALNTLDQSMALSRFGAEDAWQLGSHLRTIAAGRNAPVAIEIQRANGQVIFATVLNDATIDALSWTKRKIATALRFEQSSMAVDLSLQLRGLTLAQFGLSDTQYAAAGGAVPLRVQGAGCVGAVAMAGLSSEDDHQLVQDAVGWLLQQQIPPR
jgi:uncharacterized protein (UPF0303 family)